jgi:hypothetical protein
MKIAGLRIATTLLLLLMILSVATALRLHGIGFGLPALNDPDEPLFMMTAFEMLRNQSFNPGWFGHPGTTTLYCLALICLAVGGIGLATGRFADADAVAAALYADPGIVFLPGRLFIAACAIGCVYLTYRIGRKLGGERLGLSAAALLAVNAVHIEYSQIIRTDMQASLFMLLCALCAIDIAKTGRRRAYLLAGICVGLATATKWPGAVIALSPVCAGLWRMAQDRSDVARQAGFLALFGLTAAAALVIASPYLLLDYPTVLRNLAGEARPEHPGATGGGFFANLAWYVMHPLLTSMGPVGLALVAAGAVFAAWRNCLIAFAVAPGFLLFLAIICLQALRWERWLVPLLPFLTLLAAFALCGLADWLRRRMARPIPWIEAAAVLLLAIPMTHTALIETRERTHDTRQMASAWVRAHVPPGSSVLIEDAAFDLTSGPWRFLFPLGSAGCVDVRAALSGRIRYSKVEGLRASKPLVDLGHVDPALLPTCRADYAILSHYDRYRADPHFRPEFEQYQRLIRDGDIVAEFEPVSGSSSGPVVHVVHLAGTGQPQ